MADNGTFYWPGTASSGVTSLNTLTGAITLAAGTGISITPSGNTLTIADTGADNVTLAAFGSTPNANGLSLSSQVLNMQPADATNPGGVSIAAQTFGGTKTFSQIIDSGLTANTALIANGSKQLTSSATTDTELGYVSGVTSAIQTQINSKQATLTLGNFTEATSSVLTITGGTGSIIGSGLSVQVKLATTSVSGYLSSTDWNTFNGKQASGSYITALTSDVTASGPGSAVATIANAAVTNAKMANMASSSSTVGTAKGNISGSAAAPSDLVLTSANTASSVVYRDGSGNFSAGTITASLSGNASTVTTNASLTGDVTSSGNATTIGANKVTLGMLATLAANSVIANNTGSTATPTAVAMASAPAASIITKFDANSNLSAVNHIQGYTTTVTAAGTTTLVVGSTYQQLFTGSTTQTVVLPVTSTLVLGQQFVVTNNSTGIVTVQSSGANTIWAQPAGSTVYYTCILTSGTSASSWGTVSSNITPWVTWTPVFTGYGTVASVSFFSRRVGDTLEVCGVFTAGTPTAVQNKITVGFNGTDSNVTIDNTKIPATALLGIAGENANATTKFSWYALYLDTTHIQLAAQQATTTAFNGGQNGDVVTGTGNALYVNYKVPISGWST